MAATRAFESEKKVPGDQGQQGQQGQQGRQGQQEPLAAGLFLNFGLISAEDEDARQEALVAAIREYRKDHAGKFAPPYMVLDLATLDDIALRVDGKTYTAETDGPDQITSESARTNPSLKIVMSCVDIVDLKSIGGEFGTRSVVKCNAAVPVYRWFQAVNLMLAHHDKKGRVVPFPLDQDDGTTFHMLRVTPDEFVAYQELLEFSTNQKGVDEGFAIAAKFAYEILRKRGVSEITAAQVDETLTHVMLMADSKIRGVLLHKAGRGELEDEDLRKSHFVYF